MNQKETRERISVPTLSIGSELTDREKQILRMLFSGRNSIEVATDLKLCKRTVDHNLAQAYSKMEVTNRYDAFRRAVELGVISE